MRAAGTRDAGCGTRLRVALVLAAVLALGGRAPGAGAQAPAPLDEPRLLDGFEAVRGWEARPSDGVAARLSAGPGRTGRALRADYDFQGNAGYAVVRRAMDVALPDNYELAFWIRGDGRPNDLEVKLVDSTGENVWWARRRAYQLPGGWTKLTFRKRQIEFAWGPKGGGDLRRLAALEVTYTAGQGGRGTIWLDDLTLTAREPVRPYTGRPVATVSAALPNAGAALAVDGDSATAWRSAGDAAARLDVDFGRSREFGGLVVQWDTLDYARDYQIRTSPDGRAWTTAHAVTGGDGGADYVQMPDAEARWLRVEATRSSRGRGYALRDLRVQPLAWGAERNALYFTAARAGRRGDYPKAFTDSTQAYWTVLGAPAAEREALINEQGAVEVRKGGFSLEPFVWANDRLTTWADVRLSQALEGGSLPIPSVRWEARPIALTTTAWVAGTGDTATLYVRYRAENRTPIARGATLFVAVRPFQVNPPWQFLNTPGGWASVRRVEYDGGVVRVNGGRAADGGDDVVTLTAPAGFGASPFDAGDVSRFLRAGSLPPDSAASDSAGRVSGALSFDLLLAGRGAQEVFVAVPFGRRAAFSRLRPDSLAAIAAAASLAATGRAWAERLGRVEVSLPDSALAATLRTMQAYILVNQDGPAIQPGSRSYERSWIRDGALTSAALLALGDSDRVRPFIEWYAPRQFANGKVPCCVDARGADPVPEHDSHGEFIFLVAEYYRYTGDRALAERMWPRVRAAAAYMDSLRRQRLTPAYQAAATRHLYGIMPPSISHEGYSSKPAHSYWDDLWALRGYKDAAELAAVLGKADDLRALAARRDTFRRDLVASMRAAMAVHRIDFIPGAADLGDFDATSTTMAVAPVDEADRMPQPALQRTFDRYWADFVARRDGRRAWKDYTPYELRTVGVFVRLGQPARAHEALAWFMRDRRPAGWNAWGEVVHRDPAAPRFVGDIPHTWVGSDFIRSVLDMLAYARGADSSLVVAAAVPLRWARADSGVRVRRLRTEYGPLDLDVTAPDARRVRVRVGGRLRAPRGGIVVCAPFDRAPASAALDGARAALVEGRCVRARRAPAAVDFSY